MRAAGLRAGAAEPFAAEGLHADDRADLVAVDVDVADAALRGKLFTCEFFQLAVFNNRDPAFLAGPGTLSYVTRIDPGESVLTIHFRPGGALPFLGIPLADVENACVNLTDLWGHDAAVLREQLVGTPTWPQRIAIVEDFLLARLRPISHILMPVLSAAERQPSLRVSEAAELTGFSPKRLIATFRNEIGLAPKAYLRVRRLQAALRLLDAGSGDGADVAATLGYFDQPHFVREFRGFTSITPTQYAQRRSVLPSHVGLAG